MYICLVFFSKKKYVSNFFLDQKSIETSGFLWKNFLELFFLIQNHSNDCMIEMFGFLRKNFPEFCFLIKNRWRRLVFYKKNVLEFFWPKINVSMVFLKSLEFYSWLKNNEDVCAWFSFSMHKFSWRFFFD